MACLAAAITCATVGLPVIMIWSVGTTRPAHRPPPMYPVEPVTIAAGIQLPFTITPAGGPPGTYKLEAFSAAANTWVAGIQDPFKTIWSEGRAGDVAVGLLARETLPRPRRSA